MVKHKDESLQCATNAHIQELSYFKERKSEDGKL